MSVDISSPARKLAGLGDRPLTRIVVYYLVVFAAAAALANLVPETLWLINAPPPDSSFLAGHGPGPKGFLPAEASASPGRVLLGTVAALASACLLMLPVTWVYVLTRRKKGFQQSVVQALIVLPLVVSGIILLVQNSTALAFSLGGIVGAVAFRNRLRDTKDTIYIFLSIVVGVAAGVHALLVAATISVGFNLVALVMWWTDFGRQGAMLEGAPAERRLRQVRAIANRTSGFISALDRELLRSMTPEQLDVLAERARVRQHAAAAQAEIVEEGHGRREWTLRLEVTGGAEQARRVADPILASLTKRWEFVKASAGAAGHETLEYRIRVRRKADQADFIGRFRAAAGAAVQRAEISEPSEE